MDNNNSNNQSTSQTGTISSTQAQILRTILTVILGICAVSHAFAQSNTGDYIEIDEDITIYDPNATENDDPQEEEFTPVPPTLAEEVFQPQKPAQEKAQNDSPYDMGENVMPAPNFDRPKGGDDVVYNNPPRSGNECRGLRKGQYKQMYSQYTKIYMNNGKVFAQYPVYKIEQVESVQNDQGALQPRMVAVPRFELRCIPARQCYVGNDFCGRPMYQWVPPCTQRVFVGYEWVPANDGWQDRRPILKDQCVALQYQREIEIRGARSLQQAQAALARREDQITQRSYGATQSPTPQNLAPISQNEE